MDELVKVVSQKAGITTDQAKAAVQAVLDFLKQRLPAPVSSQLDAILSGKAPGDIASSVGGLFGKK